MHVLPDDDRDDATQQALRRLPTFDMDRAAADRIRLRCHRVLARRGWRQRLAGLVEAPLCRRVLEPTLVAALSGISLFEVVSRALRLSGL